LGRDRFPLSRAQKENPQTAKVVFLAPSAHHPRLQPMAAFDCYSHKHPSEDFLPGEKLNCLPFAPRIKSPLCHRQHPSCSADKVKAFNPWPSGKPLSGKVLRFNQRPLTPSSVK
jgi:hypothetical protein